MQLHANTYDIKINYYCVCCALFGLDNKLSKEYILMLCVCVFYTA